MEFPETKFKGQGKVLVLDDEDFMLEVTDKILRKMGFTVVTAHTSEKALEYYRQAISAEAPFVASILDLTIQGGPGGREVCTEIRKIDPDAIIIAASGYSEDPVMASPEIHGFSGRLIKPFRMEDLSELFRSIFRNNS